MSRERKYIEGQQHRLCVLKVVRTFPNGTPRVLERMSETGSVRIQGGEQFVTAYIPEENFVPGGPRLPGETE